MKDINMALLIALICNHEKDKIIATLMEGDIWTKHIALHMKGQYINSFNCLFESPHPDDWNYCPHISGFHPCIKHFSEMIEKSIPVKR